MDNWFPAASGACQIFRAGILPLKLWQSKCYVVERSLQDANMLAGLDEYQVTGWRGWHHHTAMVLLTMLFLLRLKRKLATRAPMLTLKDSVEILKIVMQKKKLSFEEAAEFALKTMVFLHERCGDKSQKDFLEF